MLGHIKLIHQFYIATFFFFFQISDIHLQIEEMSAKLPAVVVGQRCILCKQEWCWEAGRAVGCQTSSMCISQHLWSLQLTQGFAAESTWANAEVVPIAGINAQIPLRSWEVPIQPTPKKSFSKSEPAPKVNWTKAVTGQQLFWARIKSPKGRHNISQL